jgi:alpha-beta hydrolase superfamily lysophospholipase
MSQPSRFTQRIVFDVDLLNPLDSIATIAAEMNTRVAEAAYAAEAAMDHVLSRHAELAGKPRIAIGMSGGAMILPTVLARDSGDYAAAICIAGGCNFFAMSDESNYKFLIGAADFRWLPQAPTEEQREQTYQLYLEHAPLDAFNTARLIAGMPLLLIHASFDAAVPAKLGDLLWEQLGRPERWTHEAGHEELFMKLPAQMQQIMDWLDQSIPPP